MTSKVRLNKVEWESENAYSKSWLHQGETTWYNYLEDDYTLGKRTAGRSIM